MDDDAHIGSDSMTNPDVLLEYVSGGGNSHQYIVGNWLT